jgi:hypothetical protein
MTDAHRLGIASVFSVALGIAVGAGIALLGEKHG